MRNYLRICEKSIIFALDLQNVVSKNAILTNLLFNLKHLKP